MPLGLGRRPVAPFVLHDGRPSIRARRGSVGTISPRISLSRCSHKLKAKRKVRTVAPLGELVAATPLSYDIDEKTVLTLGDHSRLKVNLWDKGTLFSHLFQVQGQIQSFAVHGQVGQSVGVRVVRPGYPCKCHGQPRGGLFEAVRQSLKPGLLYFPRSRQLLYYELAVTQQLKLGDPPLRSASSRTMEAARYSASLLVQRPRGLAPSQTLVPVGS